jgi:succinoglycan biosynthesis protein ExoA
MSLRGLRVVDVLVVIPCLNEEPYIEGLVSKLLLDNEGLAMTIVVADGGSTDKTAEIARAMAAADERVVYLHNPKRLQSAAVNLAVEVHGGDAEYLIRIDAHGDYPRDYCAALLAEAKESGAASVVVAMDTVGQTDFGRAVAVAQNSKMGNGGSAHRNVDGEGAWVDHGHHALMRIDAFRGVGGYDEDFSHNEDAELDHRLGLAGHKIWLSGRAGMIYYPRGDALGLWRQYYKFGGGRVNTICKHGIIPKVRQMVPAAVGPAVVLSLAAPALAIAAVPVAVWFWACLVYGGVLAIKARDPMIAMAGPAAMIMHLAWSFGFWIGLWPALKAYRL